MNTPSFKEYLHTHKIKASSFHPYFEAALNYMLLGGGKHFRAKLLLGVVKALKDELLEKAYDAALAVEFMHTYSLIHDDLPIMDDANTRRGRPSLHKKYDEVTALLVGDALNTQAFYVLSNADFPPDILIKLVRLLSFNAGPCGMVLGQALDCYFEESVLDENQLGFLHLHKTGRLIAASLAMGAVIAGVDEEAFYKLGLCLGLIFQINDDIIDETQSPLQAGKPTHNDMKKNSYVNLLGLDGAYASKEKQLGILNEQLQAFDPKIACFIKELTSKYL